MKSKNYLTVMAAVILLLGSGLAVVNAKGDWLITPEEAAKVRPRSGGVIAPVTAVEGPGPAIFLKNPKLLQSVSSPLDIFIAFKPGKSGKLPDMKTLVVTVLGFIDIDITDRVVEYIRGNDLDIEQAKLPTGNHELRVAIKDIAGNPNERIVNVNVVE